MLTMERLACLHKRRDKVEFAMVFRELGWCHLSMNSAASSLPLWNRSGQQEYHKISQQSIPRIHLRELFTNGWKPRSLSSRSPASRKAISMETVHTILRFIDIHATSYLEYIYWLLVAIMELIQQHLSTRPKSGCWSPSQSDADTELSPCLTFIAAQRQRSYA